MFPCLTPSRGFLLHLENVCSQDPHDYHFDFIFYYSFPLSLSFSQITSLHSLSGTCQICFLPQDLSVVWNPHPWILSSLAVIIRRWLQAFSGHIIQCQCLYFYSPSLSSIPYLLIPPSHKSLSKIILFVYLC